MNKWYDGTPAIKVPMDCYQPMDMMDQVIEMFQKMGGKRKKRKEKVK